MAAGKKAKKGKNLLDQRVLGTDVRTLGVAIASAVVAEIAQAGINRASEAITNGDRAKRVRSSAKESTDTIRNTVGDNTAFQDVADTAKDAISNIGPVIAAVVDTVKDAPNAVVESAEDTVDTAKEASTDASQPINRIVDAIIDQVKNRTGDTKDAIGDTFEDSADTVKDVAKNTKRSLVSTADAAKTTVAEVNPGKKKNKKDKKSKKKNKKNKKK